MTDLNAVSPAERITELNAIDQVGQPKDPWSLS